MIMFFCSISYVRYFLEVLYLVDPDKSDPNGRKYALRYFHYSEDNKTSCATALFSLFGFSELLRVLAFYMRNSNEFNSAHDTPLFLIFILKLVVAFVLALITMILVQEWFFIRHAFVKAIRRASSNWRGRKDAGEFFVL